MPSSAPTSEAPSRRPTAHDPSRAPSRTPTLPLPTSQPTPDPTAEGEADYYNALSALAPDVRFSSTVGGFYRGPTEYSRNSFSGTIHGVEYLNSGSSVNLGVHVNGAEIFTGSRGSFTRSLDPASTIRVTFLVHP